jgi:hypothetical protein
MTCKSSGSTITGVQVFSKKDQLVKSYFFHKQSKDYKHTIFK